MSETRVPPVHDRHGSDGSNFMYGIAGVAAVAGLTAYLATRSGPRTPRPADSAPGRTRRGLARFGQYDVVGRTVTINRPRADVYAMWRDPAKLASFMQNIRAVKQTGDKRAVWTIAAPGGLTVDVETEIVNERENELIAWRSVEGSDIETEGRVALRDAPGNRGTEVEAVVAYKAPFGELGRAIAAIFQKEPAIQGRRELKRLKMLMETGEIAIANNHRRKS